jgi:uncharacterized protein (TIGR00251 family)
VKGSSARITIKVKPRASRDKIEGWQEDSLQVRLTSPPVEGAANAALIKLLARKTGVARSRISIITGEKGRSKVLEFEGITSEELRNLLK